VSRSLWIKAHLLAAAFFSPALIIMAISGGLYLIGTKGSVQQTPVQATPDMTLDVTSPQLEQDVRNLLSGIDADFEFEYLKISGNTLTTRPTSRDYYTINAGTDALTITHNTPDLVKHLVELHKGHGPLLYKDFQKVMAIALLFVLLSGAWLGLSAAGLRSMTAVTMFSGLAVTLLLATFA